MDLWKAAAGLCLQAQGELLCHAPGLGSPAACAGQPGMGGVSFLGIKGTGCQSVK